MEPLIGFVLGSETDLPIVEESKCYEVWDICEIPWELSTISADRNLGVLRDYCKEALQKGIKVLVGAAGMAARLPGTMAAETKYLLPVIGVALPSEEFSNALDAVFSITRPPSGCPVLFAGIGKAGLKNAAIAAVQILANGEGEENKKIKEKLAVYFLTSRKEPQIGFKKSSGRRSGLERVLLETKIPGKELFWRGKVRDTYIIGKDLLLMVATDRISAFDVVLSNAIPDKGLVLNQLSAFWFEKTRHIVPNHLVRVVDDLDVLRFYFEPSIKDSDLVPLVGRSMIVQKAKRLEFECVVRGYLAGSAWAEYQEKGKVSGLPLPPGMMEGQQLPSLMFTPTTKADSSHDQPVSLEEMKKQLGESVTRELEEKSLAVYSYAEKYARSRGIIIADTKMEFGLIEGRVSLIDELLTPDSSRFWNASKYEVGRSQPSFDKQPVRDWLINSGWGKEPPAPSLPSEVIAATTERYRQAYLRLTGRILD